MSNYCKISQRSTEEYYLFLRKRNVAWNKKFYSVELQCGEQKNSVWRISQFCSWPRADDCWDRSILNCHSSSHCHFSSKFSAHKILSLSFDFKLSSINIIIWIFFTVNGFLYKTKQNKKQTKSSTKDCKNRFLHQTGCFIHFLRILPGWLCFIAQDPTKALCQGPASKT